ncbi:MAG: hypothetical protein ACRCZE_02715 [Candidatus Altimarinota bacterium]
MKINSAEENLVGMLEYLKSKRRVLLLTTSNRWSKEGEEELPKSTALAYKIANSLPGVSVEVMEIPKLKIYPCEGNVSTASGNNCGVKEAMLKNGDKNPSGLHRCWASLNNNDDELWKVSKKLFESDCVVFFASIRWGQLNSYYQKLIERLTWLENRHSTLGEENVLSGIEAGVVTVGQNWHGEEAMKTQKEVLGFYGFKVVEELCWHWQFTNETKDESEESYKDAVIKFRETFLD